MSIKVRENASLSGREAPIADSPAPLGRFFPVESLNVSLEVNADANGGAVFSYNGSDTLSISVDGNHFCLIQLKLEPGSGIFLTSPVCWIAPHPGTVEPVPTPSEFMVMRHADDHVSILDLDPGVGKTFSFLVSVILDGEVYTSPDPTIINHSDPPMLER